MQVPGQPDNEDWRVGVLRDLEVLDSSPERELDNVVRLVARMFDAPIALISLVDEERQWFTARWGLDAEQTPRSISVCGHAILSDEPFCVSDAQEDERFADNPLVTGAPFIRFYLGAPLITSEGARIGTLCVISPEPRVPTPEQVEFLTEQARVVIDRMELHRARRMVEHGARQLTRAEQQISRTKEMLADVARALAHDMVTPIRHVRLFGERLHGFVSEERHLDLERLIAQLCHADHQVLRGRRRGEEAGEQEMSHAKAPRAACR